MIVTLQETASTNDYAKKLAQCQVENFTTVVARKQTAGRGRLGRSFDSPEDEGIYMSIILYPDMRPDAVSAVTMVAAVAVKRALEQVIAQVTELGQSGVKDITLGIKWPNDIVADGKKVCGILTEASMAGNAVKYVIVGIGINVNNESFTEELRDKAISLKKISGCGFDKKGIVDEVIIWFKRYYAIYAKEQSLRFILEEYNSALVHTGVEVNVIDGAGSFSGICEGIDETGALLVRESKKTEVTKVVAGEVSVRGVYGYV